MRVHYLKTWPVFFKQVKSGSKNYEVRRNDRDYDVGDTLVLQEWDPEIAKKDSNPSSGYTGNDVRVVVTHLLLASECEGIVAGFCVLGIALAHPPGMVSQ
jgi:Domain of unknown function (DUF3850)